MKRFLVLAALFAVTVLASGASLPVGPAAHPRVFHKETYVYICNSSGAYAYHSTKSCRGLNRCSHEILKVTLSEAVNTYRRKPCKICE
ncbi:MAG TPA: hypothetical protein VKQ52_07870 [Puia sp.]|nr:hypothetical protein [Puia sp.]